MRFFSTSQGWIPREHQRSVVSGLHDLKLLKFDNKRSLPLKMGGTTDIYISLREARNNPKAIEYLTDLFAEPVQRLGVSRFVEVPDSVSCFAGPLSIKTGLPYLTIREEAKEGRVSKARTIGETNPRERICIIDDVITDGASKVEPIRECYRLDTIIEALVVLVDRQQGWQKNISSTGVPVWAGMTLHDVRRELIALGLMKRCEERREELNPVILALDGKSWDEILPIVDRLRTTGCILKVNDLGFSQAMEHLLLELSVYGRVMIDLKGHDIPNTVANYLKRIRKYNPWAVTVHASGGRNMVKEAREVLYGTDTKVLAVTVLTSLDDVACREVYGSDAITTAKRLAKLAFESGADGIVCSPLEVGPIKSEFPQWGDKLFVTPGVRSTSADIGDQARVATPSDAILWGATHFVGGRQFLNAPDPVLEVERVMKDELRLPF